MMRMNKRGLFFTMITTLIVGVLLMSVISTSKTSIGSRMNTIDSRVSSVNEFVTLIKDTYSERMLRIATLTTIKYLNDQSRLPVLNLNEKFKEAVINGTIDLVDVPVLVDSSISRSFALLSAAALDVLKINMVIEPRDARIIQDVDTGPWNVRAEFDYDLYVNGDIVRWNFSSSTNATISIENFLEPFSVMEGGNLKISKKEFSEPDLDILIEMVTDGSYKSELLAPSFLGRIQDQSTGSVCCGIESFLNPDKVKSKSVSYADYCYFKGLCDLNNPRNADKYGNFLWTIPNLNVPGFLLDSYHVGVFNLGDEKGSICQFDSVAQEWNGPGCN